MAVQRTTGIKGKPPGGIQEQPIATPQPVTHLPRLDDGTLTGVGPLMISSLPAMASGADVYTRQFYRGSRVPFRRYLPVVRQ